MPEQKMLEPTCYRCGKVIEDEIGMIVKGLDEPVKPDAVLGSCAKWGDTLVFLFDMACMRQLPRVRGKWIVNEGATVSQVQ
jgi:hypothetical protein